MAREVNAVVSAFGGAIEKATGYRLTWHRLDLDNVESREEQVRLTKDWGRAGVRAELGQGGGQILTPVSKSPRFEPRGSNYRYRK